MARQEAITANVADPQTIETTASQATAELARRAIAPKQRVTITIDPEEPDDWITQARRYSRPLVIAGGWSDEDIGRIIDEERAAVSAGRAL